jgi:ribose 5-phosphate isomerase A
LKLAAARAAAEEVESGMILGLGSGSTAEQAIRVIGERLANGTLKNVRGVPTSRQSAALAKIHNVPLVTLDDVRAIDLDVDGADEIDPELRLIKGGGGALLYEKIVAQASERVIIIADDSKLSPKLGTNYFVPVETVSIARAPVERFLQTLGAEAALRRRSDGSIFLTDEGNVLLDATFGEIDDPERLASELKAKSGVVEHGLFLEEADVAIVADVSGTRELTRGG